MGRLEEEKEKNEQQQEIKKRADHNEQLQQAESEEMAEIIPGIVESSCSSSEPDEPDENIARKRIRSNRAYTNYKTRKFFSVTVTELNISFSFKEYYYIKSYPQLCILMF